MKTLLRSFCQIVTNCANLWNNVWYCFTPKINYFSGWKGCQSLSDCFNSFPLTEVDSFWLGLYTYTSFNIIEHQINWCKLRSIQCKKHNPSPLFFIVCQSLLRCMDRWIIYEQNNSLSFYFEIISKPLYQFFYKINKTFELFLDLRVEKNQSPYEVISPINTNNPLKFEL